LVRTVTPLFHLLVTELVVDHPGRLAIHNKLEIDCVHVGGIKDNLRAPETVRG
jgi:hypothetical protein